MYAGVPQPAGYPVWVIYGWLFTKLIPFSNIAWRLALSSAAAGALACGLIALMVSRGGAYVIKAVRGGAGLSSVDKQRLRIISGCVAGMVFGFDRSFWGTTVIAHTWPLTILFLASILCFLMRWMFFPKQKQYLYLAIFLYGLALNNSQNLVAIALGLQIAILLTDRRFARDLFFVEGVLYLASLLASEVFYIFYPDLSYNSVVKELYNIWGVGVIILCIALIVKTREFLSQLKPVLVVLALFIAAGSVCFLTPVLSMTNPPINWGYPRIAEHFIGVSWHAQCVLRTTPGFTCPVAFRDQILMYLNLVIRNLGLLPLILIIPALFVIRKVKRRQRNWMLGAALLYATSTILTIVVLNPQDSRVMYEFNREFSVAHVVLAIFTGYGIAMIGVLAARIPNWKLPLTNLQPSRSNGTSL